MVEMRRASIIVALFALPMPLGCASEVDAVGSEVGVVKSSLDEDESCLAGIDASDARGPFRYEREQIGLVKLWVPNVPRGCRIPVIHFANGTGARCSTYGSTIEALASHGFLMACYESTNTGRGDQGLSALEAARSAFPNLVSNKIGSMGHSQGGQAAFTVLEAAENEFGSSFVYAGLAMQPASGFGEQPFLRSWQSVYRDVTSPMFMFSGTADVLVSELWVKQAFDALDNSVEAYNWSRLGSTHIPTPNSETVEVGVPWFRWKLLGDSNACRDFYDLRSSLLWSVRDEQNAQSCSRVGLTSDTEQLN